MYKERFDIISKAVVQSHLLVLLAAISIPTFSDDSELAPEDVASTNQPVNYSPYASQSGKQVLWGDTHLHTSLSLDARAFGVTLDPDTAFRFARGEEVTSSHGLKVRLSRPLDFLVVSDHSDAMGTMSDIISGSKAFMKNEKVREWNRQLNADPQTAFKARMDVVLALTKNEAPKLLYSKDFFRSVWQGYLDTTEVYNEPGRFTALIGYEWTSTEQGNNLHRNVFYRGGAKEAAGLLPYTVAESSNPEDLWRWMQRFEDKTNSEVLAAAHNGNLSNGWMFPEINPVTGKPLTGDYVKSRQRWEPIYEVTQIKGDGEAHGKLSPRDEFADYETWDRGSMGGAPKQDDMLQYEYARAALKSGLALEAKWGANPYQFGLIGSTDSHTALATGEEDNFFGKMAYMEPSASRWNKVLAKLGEASAIYGAEMTASGYAAVWATENTREAIFDAMKRKETYATTGPRITVRFDAGFDADNTVPMGGNLNKSHITDANSNGSPVFTVSALKDPMGANLDRIQVIKGWIDSSGVIHEQVYNVVWSGKRTLNKEGSLATVGNTVDVANASYSNNIGAQQLSVEWIDPSFNAEQSAFYYARVLEIPTPRWTAFDAKRFAIEMDDSVPMITVERAYTSPIWYQSK